MTETLINNDFDRNLIKLLKEHGRKIKKYELVYLLKRDRACSELDIDLSLGRLLERKNLFKNDRNEYLLADY